ncbi:MAG TPA: MGMT family protein, partial [Bacillota bacterium]|nr:MGMT family protein [Bacillota bacterium]
IPRMSSRAVGGAVGRNPIAIIIPCHRIIGAGGALTGYGGGIENKIALLALEGGDITKFKLPRDSGKL